MPVLGMNRLRSFFLQSPLWVIFVFSFLGYGLLAYWLPLFPHYNHVPLADVRRLLPSLGQGLAYGVVLTGLFGLYGLAYRAVKAQRKTVSLIWLVATAVALASPLFLAYPFNANDIYRYFIRGRITAVYHESPFTVAPDDIPNDPYLPLAGEWAGETSPYGPVWEMVAGGVTAVAPNNLWLAMLLFKGLGLALFIACGILIYHLTVGTYQLSTTLLWLWNPALLLTFVVDAHNDVLMLFWLLWGWWLVKKDKPQIGFIVMLFAPLTKPIGLLALPFFFIHIWREMANWQQRGRFALWSGCLA